MGAKLPECGGWKRVGGGGARRSSGNGGAEYLVRNLTRCGLTKSKVVLLKGQHLMNSSQWTTRQLLQSLEHTADSLLGVCRLPSAMRNRQPPPVTAAARTKVPSHTTTPRDISDKRVFYFCDWTANGERLPNSKRESFAVGCPTIPTGYSPTQRPLPDNTYNTHKRQTSMSTAVFEPTIPASERPQTHALDRAATGDGPHSYVRGQHIRHGTRERGGRQGTRNNSLLNTVTLRNTY
jgi:hypothetical protein